VSSHKYDYVIFACLFVVVYRRSYWRYPITGKRSEYWYLQFHNLKCAKSR